MDHDAFNGTLKSNGYIFEPMGVEYLTFKINGTNHPPDGWRPNFNEPNSDYLAEYTAFLDGIGVKKSNGGNALKLGDYGKHRCFWALDLSGDQDNSMKTSIAKNGKIDLAMSFAESEKMYTILIYAIYHNCLTVYQDSSKTLQCKVLDVE